MFRIIIILLLILFGYTIVERSLESYEDISLIASDPVSDIPRRKKHILLNRKGEFVSMAGSPPVGRDTKDCKRGSCPPLFGEDLVCWRCPKRGIKDVNDPVPPYRTQPTQKVGTVPIEMEDDDRVKGVSLSKLRSKIQRYNSLSRKKI